MATNWGRGIGDFFGGVAEGYTPFLQWKLRQAEKDEDRRKKNRDDTLNKSNDLEARMKATRLGDTLFSMTSESVIPPDSGITTDSILAFNAIATETFKPSGAIAQQMRAEAPPSPTMASKEEAPEAAREFEGQVAEEVSAAQNPTLQDVISTLREQVRSKDLEVSRGGMVRLKAMNLVLQKIEARKAVLAEEKRYGERRRSGKELDLEFIPKTADANLAARVKEYNSEELQAAIRDVDKQAILQRNKLALEEAKKRLGDKGYQKLLNDKILTEVMVQADAARAAEKAGWDNKDYQAAKKRIREAEHKIASDLKEKDMVRFHTLTRSWKPGDALADAELAKKLAPIIGEADGLRMEQAWRSGGKQVQIERGDLDAKQTKALRLAQLALDDKREIARLSGVSGTSEEELMKIVGPNLLPEQKQNILDARQRGIAAAKAAETTEQLQTVRAEQQRFWFIKGQLATTTGTAPADMPEEWAETFKTGQQSRLLEGTLYNLTQVRLATEKKAAHALSYDLSMGSKDPLMSQLPQKYADAFGPAVQREVSWYAIRRAAARPAVRKAMMTPQEWKESKGWEPSEWSVAQKASFREKLRKGVWFDKAQRYNNLRDSVETMAAGLTPTGSTVMTGESVAPFSWTESDLDREIINLDAEVQAAAAREFSGILKLSPTAAQARVNALKSNLNTRSIGLIAEAQISNAEATDAKTLADEKKSYDKKVSEKLTTHMNRLGNAQRRMDSDAVTEEARKVQYLSRNPTFLFVDRLVPTLAGGGFKETTVEFRPGYTPSLIVLKDIAKRLENRNKAFRLIFGQTIEDEVEGGAIIINPNAPAMPTIPRGKKRGSS